MSRKIDVYISSLSKGLGSFGGYVASQRNVIDLNINKAKSFIYTSALPTFLVKYSLRRFDLNKGKYQKKLQVNTMFLSTRLRQIGYQVNSPSHIIPLIVGDEKRVIDFGDYLLKNGIYAQPIRYPTVPKGESRIRISVTSWLSTKEIERALVVFEKAFKKFMR